MNKPTRIILRLLASPFLLGIILIRYNYAALRHTYLALRYGGEWITYHEKDEYKTVQDIYIKLKEERSVVKPIVESKPIKESEPANTNTGFKYQCPKCGKGNNDNVLAAIHRDYCNYKEGDSKN